MKSLRIIIAVAIIGVIFICLGSVTFLDYYYMYNRPKIQHPNIGRIYANNVHGTIFYLTKQENNQLQYLGYTGAAFIIIGFIYIFYNQNKKENKHLR